MNLDIGDRSRSRRRTHEPESELDALDRVLVQYPLRIALSPPLDLYIEGVDRRTDSEANYAELRYDGPHFDEISRGYWQVDIAIDVLVTSKLNDQNIYTLEINNGAVLAAFTTDVPVFLYGDGPSDNPTTQLGCFSLCPRPDEPIRVTNFGQIQNDARFRQTSIEATYRMNLSV